MFGHVGVDRDLDFPEPMPVVGKRKIRPFFFLCYSLNKLILSSNTEIEFHVKLLIATDAVICSFSCCVYILCMHCQC